MSGRPRRPSTERARVVVLISGAGSTMAALLTACDDPSYPAQVVAVGSDNPDAQGLQHATSRGIETFALSPKDFSSRAQWCAALAEHLDTLQPDLVLCAGFMRILDAEFVQRFSPRLLNSHPALLPSFPGAHAVRDALDYGVKVTGATLHVIDPGVDTGPIVAQRAVAVEPDDDEASLHERIKMAEREMLVSEVARVVSGELNVIGREVRVQ